MSIKNWFKRTPKCKHHWHQKNKWIEQPGCAERKLVSVIWDSCCLCHEIKALWPWYYTPEIEAQ